MDAQERLMELREKMLGSITEHSQSPYWAINQYIEALEAEVRSLHARTEALVAAGANALALLEEFRDGCDCEPCRECGKLAYECSSPCNQTCSCTPCGPCRVGDGCEMLAEALKPFREERDGSL